MKARILTGLVALPLLGAIILFGGSILFFVIWAATLLSLYEYFHAIESTGRRPFKIIGYCSTLIFPFYGIYEFLPDVYNKISSYFLGLALLVVVALLYVMYTTCVVKAEEYSFDDVAHTLFSVFYITIPFFLIMPIYYGEYGKWLVFVLFIISWGTDIFAYFVGVFFGKHKIMPKLSPKKSWEGFFGGLVGSVLLMTIYGIVFTNRFGKFDWWIFSILGLVLSLVSQYGDWFASSIKRRANIKDFGNILPGHGGFVDRFDSVIYLVPFVYIFSLLLTGI